MNGGACGTHERRAMYWVLVGKPGRDLLEDLGVDGIIKSKLILSRIGGCGQGRSQ